MLIYIYSSLYCLSVVFAGRLLFFTIKRDWLQMHNALQQCFLVLLQKVPLPFVSVRYGTRCTQTLRIAVR